MMFKKPVETKKIMIEVVACNRFCMMRSGLIEAEPVASAASKLPGTECALVKSQTLIDTRNGGLRHDNEFIKAIKTRPTWDAYKRISQGHGSHRERRNREAERYVATKVKFNHAKTNVHKFEIAAKQAIEKVGETKQASRAA
jgi:hypothetical protein